MVSSNYQSTSNTEHLAEFKSVKYLLRLQLFITLESVFDVGMGVMGFTCQAPQSHFFTPLGTFPNQKGQTVGMYPNE